MFTSNKTKQWLEAKSEEDKKSLVADAMRNVPNMREAFREKREEIHRKQKSALLEKMRKEEERETKRLARLEKFTDKIIYFRLWQNEEEVDGALASLQYVTERKEALKAQLNFRRYVLKQKPPKEGFENVYNFSFKENGRIKQCSEEQLVANLKQLVHHAFTMPVKEPKPEHSPILVGKHVQHKFLASDACEKWWRGKVVSQVPGYPSWYNIVYNGDEAVYTYQLLQDWEKGNLKINVLKE